MRKNVVFLIFILGSFCEALTWGDLEGSGHDFSGRPWLEEGKECSVCHSFAQSFTKGRRSSIGNHRLTSASFSTYSSVTMRARPSRPEGISLFCLSCHDGTVPVDAFEGRSGSERCDNPLGTDLSEIHPISVPYDRALARSVGHLRSPSEPSGLGGTIEEDLLKDGRVECTSCHESHDRYNETHILIKRDGQGRAGLCGICHSTKPPGSIKMGRWE